MVCECFYGDSDFVEIQEWLDVLVFVFEYEGLECVKYFFDKMGEIVWYVGV